MKPLVFIRPDDKQEFSLNEDGKTYSNAQAKRDFPKHVHHNYSEEQLRFFGFYALGEISPVEKQVETSPPTVDNSATIRWRNSFLSKAMDEHLEGVIRHAYNRAHKHTDNPTEDQIVNQIYEEVTDKLHEMFIIDFRDQDEEDEF